MRRLVERWIAEGFVKARTGVNTEDVAKGYFNELINRSMLQPARVNIEGVVKSCRVHDIVRDVMVSIARDENFVYLVGDDVTSAIEENFRHVSYHGRKCLNIGIDWSHVRSISVFGDRPVELSASLSSPALRVLRALDLQDANFGITQKDINYIGSLHHLKYVNLFRAEGLRNIYKLPRSIGKLHFLQTLDMRCTYISNLPNEISNLHCLHSLRCTRTAYYHYFDRDRPTKCLRNILSLPMTLAPLVDPDEGANKISELHMANYSYCFKSNGVRIPKGFSNLKVLDVLEVVDVKRTSSKAFKELGELIKLSKLGLVTTGATEKKCKILSEVIEKLSSLGSLCVQADYWAGSGGKLDWLHSISSPPPPPPPHSLGASNCLMRLVKIYLMRLVKGGKTMELLGTLPNLMFLFLHSNAYVGEKLVFGEGAFQNLRKLDFAHNCGVREVRFDEGTSPLLEKKHFSSCRLESGIIGIKHLPKLAEISLHFLGQVARLGVLQDEVDAHPNYPVLRLSMVRSIHDLRDIVQGSYTAARAEEATEGEVSSLHPDPAAAGESSSLQMGLGIRPTGSDSIREVEGSALVEDDFWSCNSDDDDDDGV
ncbi:hypothetical protein VPH35_069940 [Triticum aestivum]